MKKVQSILCKLAFLVLCIFMVTIIARLFIKNIVVEKLNVSNDFTVWALQGVSTVDAVDEVTGDTFAQIDWEKMYPFQNQSQDVEATEKKESLI